MGKVTIVGRIPEGRPFTAGQFKGQLPDCGIYMRLCEPKHSAIILKHPKGINGPIGAKVSRESIPVGSPAIELPIEEASKYLSFQAQALLGEPDLFSCGACV